MSDEADRALRKKITSLLASGMPTRTEPFPEDSAAVAAVLEEIRALAPDDLAGKLDVAGFIDHPYGKDRLRCLECMYYLPNKRWCVLPELDVPAEPEWWCRLWRI